MQLRDDEDGSHPKYVYLPLNSQVLMVIWVCYAIERWWRW